MRKILFFPLTAVYYLAYFLWDLCWKMVPSREVSSRVISVGNIAVGGTGKTSLVEYLAARFSETDIKTAVVAKGYKRPASSSMVICDSEDHKWELCGDEAAALARSLKGIKIYVDSNKTIAAQKASDDGNDVIVVDDGFQHRLLKRDLDIVCINGENPFGNRLLLPSGILREPIKSLQRADAFVVFVENNDIDISGLKLPAGKPAFKARKMIVSVETGKNESMDLNGKKVVGFCGIANPDSFYNTLQNTGADIVAFEKFKDHYIYKGEDIKRLIEMMETGNAETAVTTLKDFVKIEKNWPHDKKLCYIKISLAIDNEYEFIRLIENE
ncbi:MAG: tetraacyldisaccharide 4'-kinase [Candidatus Zixiibacteriota bacterium]|nr:MAG: tetraacyldisaccharide 4'-kinase [candidate division Zixibacteria bacterium]